MELHEWDVVVIGGGAAGLSAAQMLGRARRRTLVVDGGSPRNRFADHMHGILGLDGTPPADVLARGRDEVRRYGVDVRSGAVAHVRDAKDALRVTLDDGTEVRARAVVVASGVQDDLPDVSGLRERWGRSILHCPYCHGWEVADRRLGVLVTSAAGTHQLELVRQWSDDVTAFIADVEPLDEALTERLAARGFRVVASAVTALSGDDGTLAAVRTADGTEHPVDALFVAPGPRLDLAFVAELDLARADLPGRPLAVDALGATSHPRVWAAGNVAQPFANVPVSMGAGSMAGAAVNAALVAEDAERAVADARRTARSAAWEARYADTERTWSGRVNATLADVVAPLAPGSALDVGCGEGGDAVWLAEHGWRVTATDVSATAVARATAAARERGLDGERAVFVTADAELDLPDGPFDLVSASFLHSWDPDFPRIDILRAAAERVAPGGHLLVVSHAAPPSWVDELPEGAPRMAAPDVELALLAPDAAVWTPVLVETRSRAASDPDGHPGTHTDDVLLLQRR